MNYSSWGQICFPANYDIKLFIDLWQLIKGVGLVASKQVVRNVVRENQAIKHCITIRNIQDYFVPEVIITFNIYPQIVIDTDWLLL